MGMKGTEVMMKMKMMINGMTMSFFAKGEETSVMMLIVLM